MQVYKKKSLKELDPMYGQNYGKKGKGKGK